MKQQKKQQVAVIGAGVIGLCSAYRLQQMGYQVTIFDGNGVATGASFGNAGHFATEQVFPLADPALLPQLPKMLLDPLGPFKIRANYFVKAMPWFCRFMLAMRGRKLLKISVPSKP
jgi:D-amino-acid dehydrogenase